jgi:mRNA interferase MazF
MKRRPALVISPEAFNRAFGLAYVMPIATKARGHAFEVPLPESSAVKGVVLVHQLKSLDWRARRAEVLCSAPAGIVASAVEILRDIVESGEDDLGKGR